MTIYKQILAIALAILFTLAVTIGTLSGVDELTGLEIGSIVGAVLALLFEYISWFSGWYNALGDEQQKRLMLGMVFLTGIAIFGLTCGEFIDVGLACSTAGVKSLILVLFSAVASNQTLHRLLPKKT